MKIHLVSDIHGEFSEYPYTAPEGTDVVVAAGDINKGIESIKSLERWFPDKKVFFVPGNHEYYKGDFTEINKQFEEYNSKNVTYLNNKIYTFNNVYFIGATFWSDFNLYNDQNMAKLIARDSINDFRIINYRNNPWERFTPLKAEEEHKKSKEFIKYILKAHNEFKGDEKYKSVVITHMAPHPNSVDEKKWGKTPLNAYYASDQTQLIKKYQPDLWLHGHMHDSFDYMVDKTRVVCNPRGYSQAKYPLEQENKNFNKDLIIEI